MHLLNVHSKALISVVDPIPKYAILSHTWDDNEITYDEILSPTIERDSARWAKINGACLQAQQDEFDYIWIDTCCINKASSAELSEAINSMFNWYKDAAQCYAYLSDVTSDTLPDISRSRWFTRGWTLQELLAPKHVRFYSKEWKVVGCKSTYGEAISSATGIPMHILDDVGNIRSTSVACRMSWAANRTTTRIEDTAYCLFGIFDVNMPLLYGEREKAFSRLQEEIIKISDDQSIFAWDSSDFRQGALANSPSDFKTAASIIPIPRNPLLGPYSMMHKGLEIRLPMLSTDTYNSSKLIYLGFLDCQVENDFSRQIGIFLHESDIPGIYIRCTYRESSSMKLDVKRALEAEVRSIYIQDRSRSFYSHRPGLFCRLKLTSPETVLFDVKMAEVRGIKASLDSETLTARIERTPKAFSYDVAAGFVCFNTIIRNGFIVILYFPHKTSTVTELGGIEIHAKPEDWAFDEWLSSCLKNLSSAHIQEMMPASAIAQPNYPQYPRGRRTIVSEWVSDRDPLEPIVIGQREPQPIIIRQERRRDDIHADTPSEDSNFDDRDLRDLRDLSGPIVIGQREPQAIGVRERRRDDISVNNPNDLHTANVSSTRVISTRHNVQLNGQDTPGEAEDSLKNHVSARLETEHVLNQTIYVLTVDVTQKVGRKVSRRRSRSRGRGITRRSGAATGAAVGGVAASLAAATKAKPRNISSSRSRSREGAPRSGALAPVLAGSATALAWANFHPRTSNRSRSRSRGRDIGRGSDAAVGDGRLIPLATSARARARSISSSRSRSRSRDMDERRRRGRPMPAGLAEAAVAGLLNRSTRRG